MVRLIAVHKSVVLNVFAMSKSDFAKAIINQLQGAIGTEGKNYSESSATSAMSAVATAITNYLIANTKVTISYAGIIPSTPPANDPITTDTFKIVGSCAPTGPSNSFDAWIKQIEANIIAGFQLAPKGDNGIVFSMPPFLNPGIATTQSQLKSAHDVSDESPQQGIWEIVCGGIMDWINSTAMNTTPGGGTNPKTSSAGPAAITGIKIT